MHFLNDNAALKLTNLILQRKIFLNFMQLTSSIIFFWNFESTSLIFYNTFAGLCRLDKRYLPQTPLNMGQAKDHHLVPLDQQASQLCYNDPILISADSEDTGTVCQLEKFKSRNLINIFELTFISNYHYLSSTHVNYVKLVKFWVIYKFYQTKSTWIVLTKANGESLATPIWLAWDLNLYPPLQRRTHYRSTNQYNSYVFKICSKHASSPFGSSKESL